MDLNASLVTTETGPPPIDTDDDHAEVRAEVEKRQRSEDGSVCHLQGNGVT